jgi:hypothetical protein
MISILLSFTAGMLVSAGIAAHLCVRSDRRDDAELESLARALFRTDGRAR